MDQRKIMSLGRSSLVVSLPKHWTKLNELKQGDIVSLAIQRDRSLAIFPGTKGKTSVKEISIHIDPTQKSGVIKRQIISIYLNGYTSIRIFSKDIFPVNFSFIGIQFITGLAMIWTMIQVRDL